MAVRGLRNIRPRLTDYEDDVGSEDGIAENSERDEDEDESEGVSERLDQDEGESGDDPSDNDDSAAALNYEDQVKNISFGTLKQAQDALSRKRKRGSDTTAEQEEKLEALRARLRKIKEAKSGSNSAKPSIAGTRSRNVERRKQEEEISDDHDSGSDSAAEDVQGWSRTSKHAPTAMSSKRQVTRKRTVVDVPKRVTRDPRFDSFSRQPVHPGNNERAYSFLQDYQKSEIQELKAAMKKARSEEDRETLKRKINSMENRIKTREAKEREQEIVRRHRKEEREKVQQGKNPYFLKKKDIKERALVEKFKGMKGKDREKLMERRKRKESQKEKRRMPESRRFAG